MPASRDTPQRPPERDAVQASTFRENVRHWVITNPRLALRLLELVEAVMRDPFRGIGKPEPLRHGAANTWSRRLTDEHRLVYRVERDRIIFLRAHGHYDR